MEATTDNQQFVLSLVRQLGEASQKQILQEANRHRQLSQPYLSALLHSLEKKGLIESKITGKGNEHRFKICNIATEKTQQVSSTPNIIARPVRNNLVLQQQYYPHPSRFQRENTFLQWEVKGTELFCVSVETRHRQDNIH
jgi:predicted transcriptional regulator